MGSSSIALPIETCTLARLNASTPTQRLPPPRQGELRRSHVTELVICDQAIEHLFCRLKNWRRIPTRYDRIAETYLAGVALVTAVTEWTQ